MLLSVKIGYRHFKTMIIRLSVRWWEAIVRISIINYLFCNSSPIDRVNFCRVCSSFFINFRVNICYFIRLNWNQLIIYISISESPFYVLDNNFQIWFKHNVSQNFSAAVLHWYCYSKRSFFNSVRMIKSRNKSIHYWFSIIWLVFPQHEIRNLSLFRCTRIYGIFPATYKNYCCIFTCIINYAFI